MNTLLVTVSSEAELVEAGLTTKKLKLVLISVICGLKLFVYLVKVKTKHLKLKK